MKGSAFKMVPSHGCKLHCQQGVSITSPAKSLYGRLVWVSSVCNEAVCTVADFSRIHEPKESSIESGSALGVLTLTVIHKHLQYFLLVTHTDPNALWVITHKYVNIPRDEDHWSLGDHLGSWLPCIIIFKKGGLLYYSEDNRPFKYLLAFLGTVYSFNN